MARNAGLRVRMDSRERKALGDKGIDVPNGDGGMREETASETARRLMGLVPHVPAEGPVRMLDAFYVLEGLTGQVWVELVKQLPPEVWVALGQPMPRNEAQAALCRWSRQGWTLRELVQLAEGVVHDEAGAKAGTVGWSKGDPRAEGALEGVPVDRNGDQVIVALVRGCAQDGVVAPEGFVSLGEMDGVEAGEGWPGSCDAGEVWWCRRPGGV